MSSLVFLLDQKLDSLGLVKYLIYAAILALMAIVARKKRWLTMSGIVAAVTLIIVFYNFYRIT